jgi:hypothetical protein
MEKPPFKQSRQENPHEDSLQGIVSLARGIVETIVAVLAAQWEIFTRHKMGSRYQNIVTLLVAPMFPVFLLVYSLTAGGRHAAGLIGMGVFYLVQWAFTWKHYLHVIYVIMHPDKEEMSREDGEALPFIKAFPKGDKWAMERFVYEPSLLLVLGVVLTALHVVTLLVGGYMVVGAVAMMLRAVCIYFKAWEYIRDILDDYAVGVRLAGGRNTPAGEEAMRRVVERITAGAPTHIPRAVYRSVQAQARAALPPELRDLMDEAA